jgi:hypothetical protein
MSTGVPVAESESRPHLPQLKRLAEAMRNRYCCRGGDGTVVLFVLGAAASFRSHMPAWHSIKDKLVTAAEGCFAPGVFVEEAWNQLGPYLGPPPPTNKKERLLASAKTEQILGVACTSEVVRAAVQRILLDNYRKSSTAGLGEAPQLGYELIAHFLRHGFIDHIVNFNFDEALDVALDNELGTNGYRRILSDSDVLAEEDDSAAPHYVKLHGTISIPSTLRFTKDHTQSLSPAMLSTLDRVAFPRRARRLHLVTLGYSWNDPDFANWVVARTRLIERVTIIRGNELKPPPLLSARYAEHRKTIDEEARLIRREVDPRDRRELEDFVDTLAIAPLRIHTQMETAIDDVLWAVANGIQSQLKDGWTEPDEVGVLKKVRPVDYVPIARHVILGYMFGNTIQVRDRDGKPINWEFERPLNKHDANQRLRLELWLHLFKCKGMVTLSGIAETPRIQRYMEASAASTTRPLDNLGQFAPLQVRETLFHASKDAGEAFGKLAVDGFTFADEPVRVPQLDVATGKLTSPPTPERELIKGLVQEIWDADETEVTTTRDPRAHWLFSKPEWLTSYPALRGRTNELLLRQPWTHLFVIAESGEWLARWYRHHHQEVALTNGRQVLLIRVSDVGLDDWGAWPKIKTDNADEFRARGLLVHEMELPWWRHNRHLTLAATLTDGAVQFHQGIYFRRRLKTSRIRPVSLRPPDCVELFLVFLAYAVRALPEEWENFPSSLLPFADFLSSLLSFAAAVRHLVTERDRARFETLVAALSKAHETAAQQPAAPAGDFP